MAPRQIAVQLVSLGEHRGHKVIEGRAPRRANLSVLHSCGGPQIPSSFIGRLHTEAELPTENGGSAPARSIRQTTTGYPTKSFKSPKEAEKSETTRRSSSAYSAESSGW